VTVRAEVGSLAPYVYYAFERSSVRMGAASVQTLCRSAQPVPREVAEIRGKSYAHRPEDWTPPGTDERDEGGQFLVGFRCLEYPGSPSKLLYFQMNYTSDSSPTSRYRLRGDRPRRSRRRRRPLADRDDGEGP
jgi:hypothetical protein